MAQLLPWLMFYINTVETETDILITSCVPMCRLGPDCHGLYIHIQASKQGHSHTSLNLIFIFFHYYLH